MDPLLLDASASARARREITARLSALEATRRVYDAQVVRFGPTRLTTDFTAYGRQTSNTGFTVAWRARLPSISAPALAFASFSYAPVGTTAEWRIVMTDSAGSSTSPVGSAAGTGAFRFVGFDWLHGRTLWGGAVTIDYEIRVAAGPGPVAGDYPQSTLRDPAQALIVAAWTVV